MEDLHTKYRPTKFGEVIGQRVVVRSLEPIVANDSAHAFLFTGPSGVGKTTLARIVARLTGCDPGNIIEIDAATYTGIDAMRSVTESTNYLAFGKSPNRACLGLPPASFDMRDRMPSSGSKPSLSHTSSNKSKISLAETGFKSYVKHLVLIVAGTLEASVVHSNQ